MIAPGREILSPIVQLRVIFLAAGIGFVGIIILLIRLVTLRTTLAIKNVSDASLRLARGEFGEPLPVRSRDEAGGLTRSFNAMTAQLKERINMKAALLMASARMALRARAAHPGGPAEVITDVNRLISCDTAETGHFMQKN